MSSDQDRGMLPGPAVVSRATLGNPTALAAKPASAHKIGQ